MHLAGGSRCLPYTPRLWGEHQEPLTKSMKRRVRDMHTRVVFEGDSVAPTVAIAPADAIKWCPVIFSKNLQRRNGRRCLEVKERDEGQRGVRNNDVCDIEQKQ